MDLGKTETCEVFQYDHGKHTGGPRDLSIHRTGVCPAFQADDSVEARLGAFTEFMEHDPTRR